MKLKEKTKGWLGKRKGKRQQTESAPMVGTVYRSVARKSFAVQYLDMGEHEVEDILAKSSFDEIEEYVDLKRAFDVMVSRLKQLLATDEVRLPNDFEEVMLYSETPEDDVEEVTIGIRKKNYSELYKGRIVNELLREAHDYWVQKNAKSFFETDKERERYRFLRYELIGQKAALEYRIYVDDILAVLGLDVSDEAVRTAYRRKQDKFFDARRIRSQDDLTKYVIYEMRFEYGSLTQDIMKALGNEATVREIVNL